MSVLRVILLAAALLAGGCASSPRIYTNENPTADFTLYTSYDFQTPLGTDRSNGIRTPLSQYLIDAVEAELEERGYVREANAPSMIVNCYLNTEEKLQTYTVPSAGYYGYRSGYYGAWGGYETQTYQYTVGTLSIDLVDPQRNVLVWEGIAEGELTEKVLGDLQAAVTETVAGIFARFPHMAGAEGVPGQ